MIFLSFAANRFPEILILLKSDLGYVILFVDIRLKMKDNAVPSVRLAAPVQGKQLKFGAICCVDGCFTKTRSSLTRFPGKTRLREAWYRALGIGDGDRVANLMVCHRHFKSSDFRKGMSLC